jgi:hypothetical protein
MGPLTRAAGRPFFFPYPLDLAGILAILPSPTPLGGTGVPSAGRRGLAGAGGTGNPVAFVVSWRVVVGSRVAGLAVTRG